MTVDVLRNPGQTRGALPYRQRTIEDALASWDRTTCWPWDGSQVGGYAIAPWDGKPGRRLTHISLTLDGRPRPAPPGDNALHSDLCTSRLCWNPAHLRWGTKKENSADASRVGSASRLNVAPRVFLPDHAVAYIRRLHAEGESYTRLAEAFGVSKSTIANYVLGRYRTEQ